MVFRKMEKPYIFEEELYYNCSSDVDILRKGCVKFSFLIKESGNVAPLYNTSCVTTAGLSLKNFCVNFFKKNCIGIIPASGYRGKVKQSLLALIWLEEINKQVNGCLEYKCSLNGEKMILNRYVDGFYNNVVYQFHSCYFHGCNSCFHPYEVNKINNEKFCNLYLATKKITHEMENAGYRVVEKWECDFLRENKFTKDTLNEKK